MTVLISAYFGARFSLFDIARALIVVLALTAIASLLVILLQASFAFDSNGVARGIFRSEEHTSELQSLMRISYAVFCLKKKKNYQTIRSKTDILTPTTTQTPNH